MSTSCRSRARAACFAIALALCGVVPRMFHDLPPCVEADEMQQHFHMYPP